MERSLGLLLTARAAAISPLSATRDARRPRNIDPFGIYRLQAGLFVGKSDGKSWRAEIISQPKQWLRDLGDN